MRFISILFLIAGLAGCGSLEDLLAHQNPAELDAVKPTMLTYKTLVPTGMGTNRKFEEQQQNVLTLYGRFLRAQGGYSLASYDEVAPNVHDYLDAGIAISDLACSDWFVYHDNLATRANYSKGLLDILGAITVSSLGFADASSTAMGAVALLFGGIDAGYANFEANFKLSAILGKLEENLAKIRAKTGTNLRTNAKSGSYTFPQAKTALRTYHKSCSRRHVERYISDSVDISGFAFTGADLDFSSRVKKAELPPKMFELLNGGTRGTIHESKLRDFYFALEGSAISPTVIKIKESLMYDRLKTALNTLKDSSDPREKAKYIKFVDAFEDYAEVAGFRAELNQLLISEAKQMAENAVAASRLQKSEAFMGKIETVVNEVSLILNSIGTLNKQELNGLIATAKSAESMLSEINGMINLTPDGINKNQAKADIANALAELTKMESATGLGENSQASKDLAKAAFAALKNVFVPINALLKETTLSDEMVKKLEDADRVTLDIINAAKKLTANPAATLLFNTGAAGKNFSGFVEKIKDAERAAAMAVAAAQNAISTTDVGRLPTTFQIVPGR